MASSALFYILGTVGALTTTLIPHTHRLPVVLLRPPTIAKVMVCDTACVSCEGGTDLLLPLCADLSHRNTTGVFQCLGKETCCDFFCNHKSFDKCRADCSHHRVLSADITFANSIRPPRTTYVQDCGSGPCSVPTQLHPPRYTLTIPLLIGLISSLTAIVIGIVLDVLYTNLIVFAFMFLIWIIIVGLTCLIIYVGI